MEVDNLLSKLHGVSESSNGWIACCPTHDDHNPSLSISLGDDSRILLHCHAGCSTEDVIQALGLVMTDLMPPDDPGCSGIPTESRWTILDATTMEPAAMHVRQDHPGKSKKMWWEDLNGNRGLSGIKVDSFALYGVERLGDLEDVVVCEGEKAADALLEQGIAAVGTVTGANVIPCNDALQHLLGRHVILWPDHDDTGRNHMRRIGEQLLELGHAGEALAVIVWGEVKGDDAADAVLQGENHQEIIASTISWSDWISSADRTSSDRHNCDCSKSSNGRNLNTLNEVSSVVSASARPDLSNHDNDAWRPFPIKIFPDPVRSYVMEGAAAIGCDPSMISLPILAMLGASIGLSRRIRLKNSWLAPPTIWGGVIGESGDLKSPSQEYALRPLMAVQHRAMLDYQNELQLYQDQFRAWEGKNKACRGPRPIEPVAKRYICSDITTEGLAPILERAPRGVLVAVDELAGWIGSFDRYSSGSRQGADGARWLSLHRADKLIIDRKSSPTIYAPHATASVIGGIQPGVARRRFSGEAKENGLVARLLLVAPPKRRKRWTDSDVSEKTTKAMEAMVRNLTQLDFIIEGKDAIPVDLPLTPGAYEIYKVWYNRHAERLADSEGLLAGTLAKLEEYSARIALIIELAGSPIPSVVKEVGEDAIEAGAQLADWFADEAERIHKMLNETTEQRADRELVEWLTRQEEPVTARDVMRHLRRYSEKGGAERATRDLQCLAQAGRIKAEQQQTGKKGGRPTTVYWVLENDFLNTADADETPSDLPPSSAVNHIDSNQLWDKAIGFPGEVSSASVPPETQFDTPAETEEESEWTF